MDDPKLKDTNPKEAIGSNKIPFHVWPETATVEGVLGMLEGVLKYGRSNYRVAGVRASVYYDACRRHLNAWFEGEDKAPDSEISHLGHALACIAILIDAREAGKLNDDRMVRGGYHAMVERLTPDVKRLKEKHADKNPHQFTIADSAPPEKHQDPSRCVICGSIIDFTTRHFKEVSGGFSHDTCHYMKHMEGRK